MLPLVALMHGVTWREITQFWTAITMGFKSHKQKNGSDTHGDTNGTAADSVCVNQWNIEPPNSPTSNGVCGMRGESREFKNSYGISSWDNRKKHNPKNRSNAKGRDPSEKRSA